MLMDHFIMSLIIVPPLILFSFFFRDLETYKIEVISFIPFLFFTFLYFNKDFYNAKSPAKRLIGYQIINATTNKAANEFQCFLRNITIPFWPIEIFISLINPQRRLGDLIANTKVIPAENESLKSIWHDIKSTRLKPNFLVIIITNFIYIYPLCI